MEDKLNTDQIKVLQVFGSLNLGGAESRMMDVYRHIDRQQIVFDFVIFQQDKQAYEDEVRDLGGRVYRLKMPSARTVGSHISDIRKILREGHYQAVHAHTSYHSGLVMLAARLEGVKVGITHGRTTGSVRSGNARLLMQGVGKTLIKLFATKRYAISQKAGQFLFGSSQFEVLPNAIDIEKYQKEDINKSIRLRQSFQITDESFVLVQIGRMDPMKNHIFTLRWFTEYRRIHSDALLLIVGDHPDANKREALKQLAVELHVSDYVRFVGYRNDIEDILHISNVLLLPSLYEGLGGVVLEAQAAGIPSVISEAIPEEADMEIGLVRSCSLKDGYASWNQAVDQCRVHTPVSYEEINQAFDAHHYSLRYEIERLQKEYIKGGSA